MEDKIYIKLLAKIAKNIKTARLKKKLTQEDMIQFGFGYRFYQKLESGRYSFNLFTLHRVAAALKVNIQDLLRRFNSLYYNSLASVFNFVLNSVSKSPIPHATSS